MRVTFAAALLAVSCGSGQGGVPAVDGDGGEGGVGGAAEGAGGTGGTATSTGTGGGGGGEGGGGPAINEGFIGGPCDHDMDCAYEGGFCLTEEEGFPDGMCSLDCSKFCPDQDGAVTTFCATPEGLGTMASEGLCTTRCDYGQSPTGCREGYQCQLQARYGEPDVKVYACVPGTDDPLQLSACHQELLALGVAFSPAVNPLDHPEGHPELTCDVEDPLWLQPVLSGVSFRPSSLDNEPKAMFTACPHALSIIDTAVILDALEVTDMVHLGIYNCRTIAGTNTLSEHGRANAIDIAGLRLMSGEYYTVEDDYVKNQPNPVKPGDKLLKTAAKTMFDQMVYNIILSPDYNDAHYNHYHCDLTPGSHFMK